MYSMKTVTESVIETVEFSVSDETPRGGAERLHDLLGWGGSVPHEPQNLNETFSDSLEA